MDLYTTSRIPSPTVQQPSLTALKLKIVNNDADFVCRTINTTPLADNALCSLLHTACRSKKHNVVEAMFNNLSYTPELLGNLLVNEMEMYGTEGGLVRDLLSYDTFKTKALDNAYRIATEKGDELKNKSSIIDTLIKYGAQPVYTPENG
jgi:hypothetical protein